MTAALLPDGRRLSVADSVRGRVGCGALVVAGAVPGDPGPLAAETEALAVRLRERHAGREPSAIEGLREARALYNAFGMEPSRHRPSSEALLRRVLQGKGLYRLGNAVDVGNLASLSFLLPIGLYDLAKVDGDVELRLGAPGEGYDGIRKDRVNVGGRLSFHDARGPFGSPTSDSLRTCTDEHSTTLLAVVLATAAYDAAAMSAHLDLLADLYARHCGAREAWRALLGAAAAGGGT